MLAEVFEHDVSVFLVATGTAANALALSALTPPWGAVFCHEESHVIDDECGAPEMFTDGAKLIGIRGVAGKYGTGRTLRRRWSAFPVAWSRPFSPPAVSVSQVTEAGTLYSLEEIDAIPASRTTPGIGHAPRRCPLRQRDGGARLLGRRDDAGRRRRHGLVRRDARTARSPARPSIFFDKAHCATIPYRRKRSGHTLSKGRLLGAQMCAYLENGHWIANARHANAMARKLAEGIASVPGVRLPWPTQANEIFAVIPAVMDAALTGAGFGRAPWASESLPDGFAIGPGEVFVRWVTSFATREADIDALIRIAAETGVASRP